MTVNPFGTTPPTIPTIASMGNAALIDDPEFPPIPTQQPTADQLNLHDLIAAAAAMLLPFAIIKVTNSGATYTVANVWSSNPNLATGDFAPTRTGVGQVLLDITANKFPMSAIDPLAWGMLAGTWAGTTRETNAVTIHMQTWSGGAVTDRDSPFIMAIWGTA